MARRTIEKAAKKAGLRVPSTDIDKNPQMLSLRIQSLEKAVQSIGAIHSENMKAIRHAFDLTDVHIAILQKLVLSIQEGGVYFDDGKVDIKRYYSELHEIGPSGPAREAWVRGASLEEALALKPEEVETQPDNEPAKIEVAADEVFGGDYQHG